MRKVVELSDFSVLDNSDFDNLITRRTNIHSGLGLSAMETFKAILPEYFKKKLFLVYKGKLRQFKFIKQAHFPFTFRYNCYTIPIKGEQYKKRMRGAILVDIAGIGKTWVFNDPIHENIIPFDVFESVEDYDNGITHNVLFYVYKYREITEIYKHLWDFRKTLGCGYATIYRWDGTKVVREQPKENISLGFTWDGNKIETGMDGDATMRPYYVNEEICAKDNKTEVEYLDDEDEEPQEKRISGMFIGLAYDLTEDEVNSIKELIKSFAE